MPEAKRLFLLRHAKSSWDDPGLDDHERPLASRGRRAVEVLGLRNGIAFPQLIAHPDGSVAVVEVAARIPGGQMADLVRHATGVDLVDIALRLALGEPVPDEVARPRFQQPLAIRFLTAQPGPLPTGRVKRIRASGGTARRPL